jgi:hypothetical protein
MQRIVLATMMALVFTLSVWAQAPQTQAPDTGKSAPVDSTKAAAPAEKPVKHKAHHATHHKKRHVKRHRTA